jgi:hypothetical protein
MSKTLSPSPCLNCSFATCTRTFQRMRLADPKRARRCFHWAFEMADDKDQSHPRWHEIKELHQEWKDTWFGAEFGLGLNQGIDRHPDEDVHIQWVEDAVTVAKTLGEEDGWDKSPWEALLAELIEMGQ